MSARYSHLKAFKYPDRIEAIREGTVAGPVHVQLILSDLCNQHCFPAGTLVKLPHGSKPIEQISVGDMVAGPDGNPVRVSAVGDRLANEIFEIRIGERVIQATGEHPFLTADGWTEAERLRAGRDRAVVRVRMRAESEVESTLETVGRLRVRPPKIDIDKLFRMEGVDAAEGGRGSAARMFMRVWPEGEAAFTRRGSLLGELHRAPPDARQDRLSDAGRHRADVSAYAAEQPDEAPGDCRESIGILERCCAAEVPGGYGEHGSGGEKADAVGFKPDEKPRYISGGAGEEHGKAHEQERIAFQGMVRAPRSSNRAQGERNDLDRSSQPGLPHYGTEETDRGDTEGVFPGGSDKENRRGLRCGYDQALSKQRLAVPGGVQGGSSRRGKAGSVAGDSGLCIAGIELERGLELRSIDSVRRIAGRVRVYNFSCPPIEAYEANGCIVHNCNHCCYRDESSNTWREMFAEGGNHNPNRMLSFAKIIEILDDCAEMGVRGIELTGGGEPTIHKQFAQVVDAINARGIKWGIVTNGVRVQDLSSASWVRVSLDAALPETYAKQHAVEPWHFKRALDTIGQWKTSVSFVVAPNNWREIYDAAVLVKSLGAQSFRIRPYQSVDGGALFAEFIDEAKALSDRAVALAEPGFDVDYQLDSELDALESGKQDYDRCGFQYFKTWIGADENLYRCCIYAYSPRGLIGSIKGRRFKDVWREVAIPDFAKFNARGCENCRYAGTNRAINEVVDAGAWDAFI